MVLFTLYNFLVHPFISFLCSSLQVVVEDEVTAKEIIEKGRLNKRVTIIPLNKVGAGQESGDRCVTIHT